MYKVKITDWQNDETGEKLFMVDDYNSFDIRKDMSKFSAFSSARVKRFTA